MWGQFVTFKLKNEVSISQGKTGGWKVIPGRKNSQCKGPGGRCGEGKACLLCLRKSKATKCGCSRVNERGCGKR